MREREVLQLLAEGKTVKQIASQLYLSIKTVHTHRKQIMDKLNIHSIAELTKYALREGLTSLKT
jgi:DNA-binding NarL/FixJ family response regulator